MSAVDVQSFALGAASIFVAGKLVSAFSRLAGLSGQHGKFPRELRDWVARLALAKVLNGPAFDRFQQGIRIVEEQGGRLVFRLPMVTPALLKKDGGILEGGIALLLDTTTTICLLSSGFLPGVSVDMHFSLDPAAIKILASAISALSSDERRAELAPELEVEARVTKAGRNLAFTELAVHMRAKGQPRMLLALGAHTKFVGGSPRALSTAVSLANAYPRLALWLMQKYIGHNLPSNTIDQELSMDSELEACFATQETATSPSSSISEQSLVRTALISKGMANPYGAAHGASIAAFMTKVANELLSKTCKEKSEVHLHSMATTYCSAVKINSLVEFKAYLPEDHDFEGCLIVIVEARARGKDAVLARSRLTYDVSRGSRL